MNKSVIAVAAALALTFAMRAQEHPEHPKKQEPARENPKKQAPASENSKKEEPASENSKKEEPGRAYSIRPATQAYSIDDLDKAIVAQIRKEEKKGGGWYQLEDKKDHRTWKLKLDKVHRERLSQLDEKTYFACTDFKSDDKHLLDVDFFMKDKGGKLVMSDATIHKVDGKPRYIWKWKDGFWLRGPVK